MKKDFKYFGITLLVGFLLFNAVVFLIPNEIMGITRFDKVGFWVSYALVTLSFVAQLIIAYKFVKEDSHSKRFLNIPLLSTGYISIVVSVVVGALFLIVPILPSWVGGILCSLVVAYFAIACVKASTASDIVTQIDEKVKAKTAFVRTATIELDGILARAMGDTQSEVKKVYEAIRYSDPMSTPELDSIESEISQNIKLLKEAVKSQSDTTNIITELLLLIKERNNKCKIMK